MYYFLLSNGAGLALSRMNGMYIVMREWIEGIWSRKGTILRPSQYRPARLKDSTPSKSA